MGSTPEGDKDIRSRRRNITQQLRTQLAQRLRWLIAIRLLTITSVLLPYALLELGALSEQELAPRFDFLYLLAGATYAVSLVYILLLRLLRRNTKVQAYVQFIGDLLIVTGLVYYFGGATSPFSILYLVVVIVASILLQKRAGLTVATIAWGLYAATSLAIYGGWIAAPHGADGASLSVARMTYYLATHLFGFYAVALMTTRLAQTVTTTERELAAKREDLADLEVAYRDVIESIPSGLLTTDLDDQVTSANRAACEILGRDKRSIVGQPISGCGLFTAEHWRRLAATNQPIDGRRNEVELAGDNEPRPVGYSLSPLTAHDGTPSGHIIIFQDLSEWRRLQEEVRLKDRMAAVGELASGIAHEIGNPLAAISGSVQMLSSSVDESSAPGKLLEIILKESQRLDRTIKGFLKFARPKERASVRFDIAALLSEHLELLRNSPEVAPNHLLIIDMLPPAVSIVADPDQISQIFWNLARNALRAMPGGGTLRIQGTLEGDNYQLAFIDTGRGMTEQERAKLFHPFASFFDGGTGMGMAIVYQIVEEHGGRLLVESREGEGTEILVELPGAKEIAEPAAMKA